MKQPYLTSEHSEFLFSILLQYGERDYFLSAYFFIREEEKREVGQCKIKDYMYIRASCSYLPC